MIHVLPGHNSGNVLFLILIAVALFAALSYAITSSSRGSGDTKKDGAGLDAVRIIQYGTSIDIGMQRMRAATGKQDWEFDFADGGQTTTISANATCTDSTCRLFSVKGGTVVNVDLGKNMISPGYLTANPSAVRPGVTVRSMEVLNVGTSLPEVLLLIQGINLEICSAINQKLHGLTVLPLQGVGSVGSYSGTLTDYPTSAGQVLGSSAPELSGIYEGCFKNIASADFGYYYRVLKAR